MTAGQNQWKGRGAPDKEYIVEAMIENQMSYEYRNRSAIGKLSKPVQSRQIKDGRQMRDMDVAQSSCVTSKAIDKGDEARFTLVRNLKGATSFGDAPVAEGDYLAYMHANMKLNATRTPAYQKTEDMSAHRAKDIVAKEDSELRTQIGMFLGEEYTFEAYRGLIKGRSLNLSASEQDGGLAIDIGRGAGKAISPNRIVVLGEGEVPRPSDNTVGQLDTYETAIATTINALLTKVTKTTDPADKNGRIERGIITDIRDYMISEKIAGVDVGGTEKWYVPCDPAILRELTKEGGELWEAWKMTLMRGTENPIFQGPSYIELDDLIFFKDPYLSLFRPQVTNNTGGAGEDEVVVGADGTVTYGIESMRDARSYTSSSSQIIAPMLVLGQQALLEAHSGAVEITEDNGRHGQGATIAAHIKQAFMRTRWVPKDGSTKAELNQSMAMFLVNAPSTFGGFTKAYDKDGILIP